MRTALVAIALLVALGQADAQRAPAPRAEPIKVPLSIQGALQYTPQELNALVLEGLTRRQRGQLKQVAGAVKAGQLRQAEELWKQFLKDLAQQVRADGIHPQLLVALQAPGQGAGKRRGTDAALIEAAFRLPSGSLASNASLRPLIQQVLSAAYVEPNAALALYVTEVSSLAKTIRERLRHGYEIQAKLDPDDVGVSWEAIVDAESEFLGSLGQPGEIAPGGVTTPDALDDCIKKWEEKLQECGEDAQLANIDMQNMLQKQQQTLQMMSQISKMLHDTAMAVIRKLGG